jgi:hypothetical protein
LSSGIAVSIVPGELRLLVARANGSVKPIDQLAAELPEGAVQVGLQAPNLADTEVVADVLRALVDQSEGGNERPAMVSVLIPDAAVRMALVPLEGTEPRRTEGDAMARWALRDLLPFGEAEARIDWGVVSQESVEPAAKWLMAIGAEVAVVREYEAVVDALGWTAGRVVPLTMGLSVGAGNPTLNGDPAAARLVLSGVGNQVACLVEADGVPRFHRAWRGGPPNLALELPNVQRYVEQRLDLSIVEAVIAGPESWRERAATDCEALGWTAQALSSWSAHLGAVRP